MRLLLVDDDSLLAEELADALRNLSHDVTVAGDGNAALQMLGSAQFDAIVLDRMMPMVDGMAVLDRIRSSGMTIPVIMLTALTRSADKVVGLQKGADDYVAKPVDVEELNARIMAVLRGRGWTQSGNETLRHHDIVVSPMTYRVWYKDVPIEMGKLEIGLLAEFIRNSGIILSRPMLVERVWGYDFDPKSNVVDVYVRRLRQKLIEAGSDDPIRTVRGAGYMLRE